MAKTTMSSRRGSPRATMREVAALAGVSLKTVSRVVNREPGVTDAVRERVEAAATRLDYRHNAAAGNLRRSGGRTGMIAVLVQDVSNSFSAALLRTLEDRARERHVAIIASSLDEEPERERALVRQLIERRVDAVVLMSATSDHGYVAAELRAGTPIIFVDREPVGVSADAVIVENRLGARLATDHLLSHGHRRIACLTDLPDIETAAERFAGYRDSLTSAGLEMDEAIVRVGLRSEEVARTSVLELLRAPQPPTAIFAGRNVLAMGTVRALRERGLSHEVALVGFDDFPLADLLTPGLTTVRQDVRRMGALTADLVFERLDGDESPPKRHVVRPTLVQRGSGEIPAPEAVA